MFKDPYGILKLTALQKSDLHSGKNKRKLSSFEWDELFFICLGYDPLDYLFERLCFYLSNSKNTAEIVNEFYDGLCLSIHGTEINNKNIKINALNNCMR